MRMSTMHVAEPVTDTKLDQLCVNTIRTLSIDAVQQARSGHPGTPMALAPLVYTLWNRVRRFDYHVYAVCGDGCLMEGVASEAASLAGHLGLDNLCWIYDNNHITIEGDTRLAFTEDVAARFLGYGWNVQRVGDANDMDRIEHALEVFRQTKGRPTIIILDSHIGYGS